MDDLELLFAMLGERVTAEISRTFYSLQEQLFAKA